MIKVLIVYNNPVYCQGLSNIVSDESDIEVVGTINNGAKAIDTVEVTKPDVLLMGIDLPNVNGLIAAKQISENHPEISILIISKYNFGINVIPALRAGALGYLLDTIPLGEIIPAIRSAYNKEKVFSNRASADALDRIASNPVDEDRIVKKLHYRELEILNLVAKGMSNKEIAKKLYIAERTVSSHLVHIFEKLEVSSRTEAVVFALKKSLIKIDEIK